MLRVRALLILVLLVSYGAVGARQPAVRTSVPLPMRAADLAQAMGLDSADRSQLLVSLVRLIYDAPEASNAEDLALRARLLDLLRGTAKGDTVPLPLDPSIWRETLLQRKVRDEEIVGAILADRRTALLYHGLAALDDETLGWLGPARDTLVQIRHNSAAFSVFGRSLRVKAGRVQVPGGPAADPLWKAVVGADPGAPAAFVKKLFRKDTGRLAWFYDTVAHLDPARQRMALGGPQSDAVKIDRMRDLAQVFESTAGEWHVGHRPFNRPNLDPGLVLSLLRATPDGAIAGPASRRLWERVFRDDAIDPAFEETTPELVADASGSGVDAAWLVKRISLVPSPLGRRRLETVLFGQRVFAGSTDEPAAIATALRGFVAFPALMLALERIGITSAESLAAAARQAAAVGTVRGSERRHVAMTQFQSAIGILERAARSRGLTREAAQRLVSSLAALPVSTDRGYDAHFAGWLQGSLLKALAPPPAGVDHPVEHAVLAAMAGVTPDRPRPTIEWEGRRYAADPGEAELRRLIRIRRRQLAAQHGLDGSLDARLPAAAARAAEAAERLRADRALADTLASLVYAAHLGAPDGAALAAADVATRHDFGFIDSPAAPGLRGHVAWRLPREERGPRGWHVTGSLLGLEAALGRLALRRIDGSSMPSAPTLTTNERQTAILTAALLNPADVADAARDELAAAIRRGRERVAALSGDRAELDRVAQDAGLSEWRREALGWALAFDRETVASRFSLVELLWLGAPRAAAGPALDAWGTATLQLDGCLCVQMPRAGPWESLAGRPATGQLATRGADVALRVAEALAELRLPASLAPGVIAYAMQDVVETARPAYFDDWPAFERAAREIPRERIDDYVAALAADGPLIPLPLTSPQD
jgi:hypothetical protein